MKRLAWVVFLLALLPACEKLSQAEDLDSDVIISMWEPLQGGVGRLQFFCETEKIYPCSNYSIVYTVKRSGKDINIRFEGCFALLYVF